MPGLLGPQELALYPGEQAEQIHYLRFPGLRQAREEQQFLLYAPGLHHLAFAVDSREDIAAADARALATGAGILHPPRVWSDYPAPYGVLENQ